jgi:hypothetical protein
MTVETIPAASYLPKLPAPKQARDLEQAYAEEEDPF